MRLSEKLRGVISEYDVLRHPFYVAWTEGRLKREDLKQYAEQYYAQVAAFPRFVSAIHAQCPDIEARKVLLENLVDEELKGVDHPELWKRFAEGVGASRSELASARQLPETRLTVETLFDLTMRQGWKAGLCALYAYESQVPEVSKSKIDGLKKHYGISDDRTLSFFSVHQTYDVEHSRKVVELIDAHFEPSEAASAVAATRRAAESLWGFLDGVCRTAGIACTPRN